MQLQEAILFLQPAIPPAPQPVHWCDLGCGAGLFTQALGSLLPSASRIEAVDTKKDFRAQPGTAEVDFRFTRADFVRDNLPFTSFDGILMANALHYVKDKPAFLEKGRRWLHDQGVWVIIEYDTSRANPWVPYPVNFESLTTLFRNAGYPSITKTAERRSLYNSGRMYCAVIRPQAM